MYKVKTIIIISFIFIASMLFAQHHGKGMMYHMYDTNFETTVSGTIEAIITESHPCCGSSMDHYYIKVKSGKDVVKIFLGPTNYVKDKITLNEGENVTVFGSKTTMQNETVIIAKSIKTKDKLVTFRNDDGTPKWAGKMKYKNK